MTGLSSRALAGEDREGEGVRPGQQAGEGAGLGLGQGRDGRRASGSLGWEGAGGQAKGFPGVAEAPLGQESLARWVGTGEMAKTPTPSCPQLAGRPQALQLQRRTKVMATCISPSAGHSSSTNVLIVGAGWWRVLGGESS